MEANTEEASTLIIWEEIPENTKFYLVPNSEITPEFLSDLKDSNNHFINEVGWDENEGLQAINEWMESSEGRRFEVKSESGKLLFEGVNITHVCHTGFFL